MAENRLLDVKNLCVDYGKARAIQNLTLSFDAKRVTSIIGPSGCGKSTFLRTLNRMNDFIPIAKVSGQIMYDGINIYDPKVNPVEVRRCIGMVFQKPNPFPKTIFQNVAWALTLERKPQDLNDLVEKALRQAFLWDEVKDRLHESALSLSGGQQQRLCIARSLAVQPDILLMDEPCSALDPLSTAHIEDLLSVLKDKITIIIVTHNMRQARRISDKTAFFEEGNLIEYALTTQIFENPQSKRTHEYVSGHFG